MAAGIEYRFVSNQKLKMSVRVGYNSRYVSSKLDGISGVNVGAGLDFGDTSIDYSCSLYGDLGFNPPLFLLTRKNLGIVKRGRRQFQYDGE